MTLEQVEVQIADMLTKAKKMQIKAKQLQRQGLMVARQGEVVVREKLNDYLEQGLSLLGKSIIKGRKLKESLAAETHRKIASLKKDENISESNGSNEVAARRPQGTKAELLKKASPLKPKNNMASVKVSIAKNKIKAKKTAPHFSNASRAR